MFCAIWVVCIGSARAAEFDLTVEANIEYATSQVMTAEFGNFFSPFLLVDDVRYGTVVSVVGSEVLGPFRVSALYSRDQVWHGTSENLDWTKHTGEIFFVVEPTPATQLWMRYKSKNGRPDSWRGNVDLDIVTMRLRLPTLQVQGRPIYFRPYSLVEWETGDPALIAPLAWEGATGKVGVQMLMSDGRPKSDVVISYGKVKTVATLFRRDFVDLEWSKNWSGGRALEWGVELSYRREWYEGPSADDGRHRLDQEYYAHVTVQRPLRQNVFLKFRVSAEDHVSNRLKADFFETKTKLSLETRF